MTWLFLFCLALSFKTIKSGHCSSSTVFFSKKDNDFNFNCLNLFYNVVLSTNMQSLRKLTFILHFAANVLKQQVSAHQCSFVLKSELLSVELITKCEYFHVLVIVLQHIYYVDIRNKSDFRHSNRSVQHQHLFPSFLAWCLLHKDHS